MNVIVRSFIHSATQHTFIDSKILFIRHCVSTEHVKKNMLRHRARPRWCQHLGQVAIRFNRHVTDSERERAELKTFSQLSMCPKRMATKFLCIEEVGKPSGLIGKKNLWKKWCVPFSFWASSSASLHNLPTPTPPRRMTRSSCAFPTRVGGGYLLNSPTSSSHGNLYQTHSWSAKSCWSDNLVKLKNQTSDIL